VRQRLEKYRNPGESRDPFSRYRAVEERVPAFAGTAVQLGKVRGNGE
jgi:hypothetical protein